MVGFFGLGFLMPTLLTSSPSLFDSLTSKQLNLCEYGGTALTTQRSYLHACLSQRLGLPVVVVEEGMLQLLGHLHVNLPSTQSHFKSNLIF